jgi:hypothetical protein
MAKARKQLAVAAGGGEGAEAFDLGLAVRAAQVAPDGAVRNAALELITELAAGMPQVSAMAAVASATLCVCGNCRHPSMLALK